MSRELDFADRLEARRCTRPVCGTGLSVPLLGAALVSTVAEPGACEEDEGLVALRCMHCGEVWLQEIDEF